MGILNLGLALTCWRYLARLIALQLATLRFFVCLPKLWLVLGTLGRNG